MDKIWRIIKYEYTRHVFQKRFLFSLLSLPILILVMFAVAILVAFVSIDKTPLGYVDQSGVLDSAAREEKNSTLFNPVIEFIPYQNAEQAETALNNGQIQAYYLLPETYPQNLDVQLVFIKEPAYEIQGQFSDFVGQNLSLFDNLDPQVERRLAEGSQLTITALDGSRETSQDQWYTFMIPLIAGILFFFVVITSGGYLLQAVVEEKENRTMEIVITSVSPGQLMTGKIIGDIGVGLTQLLVWVLFGWGSLMIGAMYLPALQDFSLPPEYLIVFLGILIPAFVMIAAVLAAIGATVTELREAQQFQSLVILPVMIPYYIVSTFMANPNGTLATILSFIPITAPIAMLLRMSFTIVPTWQVVLASMILILSAIFAIWFAGRAFRLGMLQYGKRLTIKEVFRKQVQQ
jgi:ABC-2 type transport system permease protein